MMGIYLTAAAVAVILCNLLLWRILMPRMMDRRLTRFQNDLVNRHYDEVGSMYREMRGWRHDYHNHIQTLKAYMALGQYAEAEEYLSQLEEDLAEVDVVLKTGNVMVDAILNSKLTMIRERDIHVDATAMVPRDISVSGVDLAVLIGNLLDNAMEACMHLPQKERFIRIYIDIIKKQLYISVTNSMEGRAVKTGSVFRSGKEGNHGFGLGRIDGIVSKHHGILNRQTENGVFATEIMIPLTRSLKGLEQGG